MRRELICGLFVLQSYGDVREVEENYKHTYGPGVWVVVGVGVFFGVCPLVARRRRRRGG